RSTHGDVHGSIHTNCTRTDKKKDCCDTARYVGVASCASRGAAYAAGRVTDLSVVVHGPSNCGYVMSHTQDNHYLSDIASNPILKVILRNNMVCTGMTNQDFIFGGHFKLTEALDSEISKGKKEIMVITTCVSGMIGDNIRKIIDETMVRHPDVHIYPINADGNLIGDSEEGRGLVQDTLIDTIDMGIEPTEDRINLVDTTFMQFNRGRNEKWLRELLEPTGLSVGVKLFEECTMEDVRTCRRNRYFALTSDILANIPIRRKLEKKGFVFMDRPLPSGYRSTIEWLDYVAGLSGHTEGCARTKEIVERQYKAALERFSPYLKGKRVAIAVSSYFNIDWIIELMLDVGMTIDKVYTYAMGPSKRGFYSRYADRLEIVEGMRVSQISEVVSASKPDLVLGNHHVAHESGCRFAKHSQEEITHQASIVYLEYLSNILKVPMGEGWKSWEGGL
ncbi:MAG: nitrogenase component 1, partial [archaeon]|nr:nitrogenase component 1 [archaeon]